MPLAASLSTTRAGPDEPVKTQRDRVLMDEKEVFNHNAWDDVPAPEDEDQLVAPYLELQHAFPASDEKRDELNADPAAHWDAFYRLHSSSFFKDRKWLGLEFPQLLPFLEPTAGPASILEVGCGAGNAFFPLVESNQNPQLTLGACDYSSEAVSVVRSNPLFLNPPTGHVHASVFDLASAGETDPLPAPEGSVDVLLLIFVFSALHPDQWAQAVKNIARLLKPQTGLLLLRDYGRHDLAQLRMKKNRLLGENFYCRGDGTRVYFFTLDEVRSTFTDAGLFEVQDLSTDRRLLVNRKLELKMYRVWQQGVLRRSGAAVVGAGSGAGVQEVVAEKEDAEEKREAEDAAQTERTP